MNSSNSKYGSSGFRSSSEMNPNYGSNSQPLGSGKPEFGSASGLSRPRLGKVRKQTVSQQPRSAAGSESRGSDLGFNPFRVVSENSIPLSSGSEMGSSVLGNLNTRNVDNEPFLFGANPNNSSLFTEKRNKSISNSNSGRGNSSRITGSSVIDDMMKLKIASDKEYVNANNPAFNLNFSGSERSGSSKGVFMFESGNKKSGIDESVVSKLQDEMTKLKVEGLGNVESSKNDQGVDSNFSANNKTHLSFGSRKNVTNSFGSSVVTELPNEMKKLDIRDPVAVDGGSVIYNAADTNGFAFGSSNRGSDSSAGSSETLLPDKMKNMNKNDSLNAKEVKGRSSNNNSFVSGSSRVTTGSLSGRADNIISDEMGKLNIGSGIGDASTQTQMGSRSTNIMNEKQPQNSNDKKSHDVGSAMSTGFTLQAGAHGRSLSGIEAPQDLQNNDTKLQKVATSSSFSSSSIPFQQVWKVIDVPSMDRPEKKVEFNFTSKLDVMGGTQHIEFKTPNSKGISSGSNRKSEAKRESAKDNRSKKKKGQSRKPPACQLKFGQDFVARERSSHENPDSFESYSPMDVSPYRETLADSNYSRETSVTSDEAFHLGDNYPSSEYRPTVSNDATDEDLVAATHHLDINEGDLKCTESKNDDTEYCFDKDVRAEGPSEESASGADTESFKSATEQLDYTTETFCTAVDTEVSSSSTIERQDSDDRAQFGFAANSEDIRRSSFTFAASSSNQGQLPAETRHCKKKNRLKVGHDSYSSTSNAKVPFASSSSVQFFSFPGTSSLLSPRQGQEGNISTLSSKSGDKSEPVKEQEVKQEALSIPAVSIAAQEACEKWRLRGNQAYAIGDLSKAEDYYTKGVNCVSRSETSRSGLRALMLCHSNRAATRMSLGRMREALDDCMMAAALDPNFLRVQVRAANCYLALGEVENALSHFMKCLQSGSEVCVDRKLLVEASEGLEKAQKLSECMKQSAELLQRRTSTDAECALGVMDEALMISSYSEKLLEMKADALFMLRQYEQLIQLCDQTLYSAEMNSLTSGVDSLSRNLDGSDPQRISSFRLWRCCLIVKSYFYLGRLEEALDFLKKQEESVPIMERNDSKTLESMIPLAGTIRELVRHKAAGNEAFQSGRQAEAVEHYTAALSCNVESRPFAAICFCNRAAAYRTMGQITDAIADCSLAIALDGNYLKAISRRATLFEMIRDYGQATIDLQRIASLLAKQVEENGSQSGASDRTSCVNELRQTQLRLSAMEEEARKEIPLNMYLILGVEPSAAGTGIKKAYRKAALKHHPDKAGQYLARSENGDDGLWKKIAEEVHKDADRLFKMIGEAYAVLSDPAKRLRYDQEEEMRNAHNRGSGSSTTRTNADVQNYPFERSGSRRQWQEVWRSYGNSQSRGSERTRSNRFP